MTLMQINSTEITGIPTGNPGQTVLDSTDHLYNNGFNMTGSPVGGRGPISIIVVGINRGGTSAVAAALNATGIFMGNRYSEPNYEDAFLANAFRNSDWKRFKEIVSSYETTHGKFAWKYPAIRNKLFRIHRYFSNPRYVFVYRDIFAIAQRKHQVFKKDHVHLMAESLWDYGAMLLFIKLLNPYVLHVSYEKLLYNKKKFAETLLSFSEIITTEDRIDAIVNQISSSPESYLHWSLRSQLMVALEKKGYKGYLEQLTTESVTGWAFRITNDQSVVVDICINGHVVGNSIADECREGLSQIAGAPRNGCIGFRFNFNAMNLKAGDLISVVFHGTAFDLVGSPTTFCPVC
jgi:hypothetical protein